MPDIHDGLVLNSKPTPPPVKATPAPPTPPKYSPPVKEKIKQKVKFPKEPNSSTVTTKPKASRLDTPQFTTNVIEWHWIKSESSTMELQF